MSHETTRRGFLRGGSLAAAGLLAGASAAPAQEPAKQPGDVKDFPRDHAGPGGPVGSPSDRGKLVPGLREAGQPPVPVECPDLEKLVAKVVDGVKEFHLRAEPVKRELLPDVWINHWGFNG